MFDFILFDVCFYILFVVQYLRSVCFPPGTVVLAGSNQEKLSSVKIKKQWSRTHALTMKNNSISCVACLISADKNNKIACVNRFLEVFSCHQPSEATGVEPNVQRTCFQIFRIRHTPEQNIAHIARL